MARSTGFLCQLLPERLLSPIAYLLSVLDEYVTSYKDRRAMAGEKLTSPFNAMGIALQYVIIIDSQFVGAWKRVLEKDVVIVQLNALIKLGPVGISAIDTQIWTFSRRILQSLKLTQDENQAVVRATRRYGTFLELPVTLRA